uniref:Uncharacterized protein n=1 Tax=Rangifer tarandus platyrhynchus TaxID=3082113 RepID=A0ACB0F6Z3_RANTA|nr:unnamed protein product [Rangifer tarandus platyrhynchus]
MACKPSSSRNGWLNFNIGRQKTEVLLYEDEADLQLLQAEATFATARRETATDRGPSRLWVCPCGCQSHARETLGHEGHEAVCFGRSARVSLEQTPRGKRTPRALAAADVPPATSTAAARTRVQAWLPGGLWGQKVLHRRAVPSRQAATVPSIPLHIPSTAPPPDGEEEAHYVKVREQETQSDQRRTLLPTAPDQSQAAPRAYLSPSEARSPLSDLAFHPHPSTPSAPSLSGHELCTPPARWVLLTSSKSRAAGTDHRLEPRTPGLAKSDPRPSGVSGRPPRPFRLAPLDFRFLLWAVPVWSVVGVESLSSSSHGLSLVTRHTQPPRLHKAVLSDFEGKLRHSSATAQEQPVDSSQSSSALRSTSWMQPPAREEHLASGLCWEVPVSLRHCSRTGRSSRAGHAAGPLSPQARSLPASRPARDKGACGGLAARRAGPRFPRRQLLAGLAKAAVLVRAPFTEGGARPGQDASSVYLQGRPCPAPSGRSGQAGGRGVSGGQWAGARARPPDSGPLLREPRADGLMGQKRSVKGDRSGL